MRKFFLGTLVSVVLVMCFMTVPVDASSVLSPEEFCDKYLGKAVDVDSYPAHQPYQCYDLWAQFVMEQYGTSYPIIINGYVQNIWKNFDALGLEDYFSKVEGKPRDGDWAIWIWSDNSPSSHMGMFRKDNGDGTVSVVHQNYGKCWVSQDNVPDSRIVGYIRPHVYDGENGKATAKRQELGKAAISVSEPEVTAGEKITFEFDCSGASDYTIRIYKDDFRIESRDCGKSTTYIRSFSEPGEYYAYVKASNDDDTATSKNVYFKVNPKPRASEPSRGGTIDRDSGLKGDLVASRDPVSPGVATVEPTPVSVTVNDILLKFDQEPVIYNGRTMVPMRAIFEALGATVDWEVGKETITATREDTKIVIAIGSNQAVVDGEKCILEAPPQLINGRTLVPVRFVSESLGAQVDWVISSQTVAINQPIPD